jgi:hypothetical protein
LGLWGLANLKVFSLVLENNDLVSNPWIVLLLLLDLVMLMMMVVTEQKKVSFIN